MSRRPVSDDIRPKDANPPSPDSVRVGVFENMDSFWEHHPLSAATLIDALQAMITSAPDAPWTLMSATTTHLDFESPNSTLIPNSD